MNPDLESLGNDWDMGEQEMAILLDSHMPPDVKDEAFRLFDGLRKIYWDTYNHHGGGVHFDSDFDPEAIAH